MNAKKAKANRKFARALAGAVQVGIDESWNNRPWYRRVWHWYKKVERPVADANAIYNRLKKEN